MRGLIVVVIVLAAALFVACVSTREQHANRINDARLKLSRSPGSPAAALTYARALTWNLNERNENDREPVRPDEIEFAAESLEKAAEKVEAEAPGLWHAEGDLWLAARDADQAEHAYRKALKARPSKDPLWALIGIAGRRKNIEQVQALCTEGATALTESEISDHVKHCQHAGGLTSEEAAIAWLKDEDKARFEKYRARIRENERKQQEAIQEAQKKHNFCRATCTEKTAACTARCTADQPQCPKACADMQSACETKCMSAPDERETERARERAERGG